MFVCWSVGSVSGLFPCVLVVGFLPLKSIVLLVCWSDCWLVCLFDGCVLRFVPLVGFDDSLFRFLAWFSSCLVVRLVGRCVCFGVCLRDG